jgi:hypothetical protein
MSEYVKFEACNECLWVDAGTTLCDFCDDEDQFEPDEDIFGSPPWLTKVIPILESK